MVLLMLIEELDKVAPLSPYLFVLALNELSEQLNEALLNNQLKGTSLSPQGPAIHSLLYADDLIITGEATEIEARIIKEIIDIFCNRSGQTPNWNKSFILFSKHTPHHIKEFITRIFHVAPVDANTKHLGHPLFVTNRTKAFVYQFIVDKFRTKLTILKANKLSHAGRLTLIKSVFASLPIYYMATTLLPKKLTSKLTSIIRTFWWTGVKEGQDKKPLCSKSWSDICKPTQEGWLGIRDIHMVNKGLILNATWRLVTKPEEQVSQVLKGKYFPSTSFWKASSNSSKSVFWSSILCFRKTLREAVTWQLADGNISIWSQPWCDLNNDIHDYIKLDSLQVPLPNTVAELWTVGKAWDVKKLNTIFYQQAVNKILQVPIVQGEGEDKLCWKFTPNGECNSKSAYKEIRKKEANYGTQVSSQDKAILKQIWKDKCIPPKIKVFAWRLLLGALPTAQRLHSRVNDITPNCCRCGSIENDFHLFFDCPFSKITWMISDVNLRPNLFPDNVSMAHIIAYITSNCSTKATLNRIFNILWQLWKARNDLKFQGKMQEPTQVCYAAEAMITSYSACMEQTQMQVNVQASTSMERKMERIPEGNRCYVDASWDDYKTGIGIFFHFPATHNALFVKANSCMADSPLQAELLALQLALEIALLLNFTDTIFLTDCSMVADTTKKRSFQEDPGYWSLLPFWSQIQTLPDHLLRVYWIPRTLNKTADKLAKEARENFSSPVFSCQNISHIAYPLRSCFASVLNSNTRFRNYNINHVLCF